MGVAHIKQHQGHAFEEEATVPGRGRLTPARHGTARHGRARHGTPVIQLCPSRLAVGILFGNSFGINGLGTASRKASVRLHMQPAYCETRPRAREAETDSGNFGKFIEFNSVRH